MNPSTRVPPRRKIRLTPSPFCRGGFDLYLLQEGLENESTLAADKLGDGVAVAIEGSPQMPVLFVVQECDQVRQQHVARCSRSIERMDGWMDRWMDGWID